MSGNQSKEMKTRSTQKLKISSPSPTKGGDERDLDIMEILGSSPRTVVNRLFKAKEDQPLPRVPKGTTKPWKIPFSTSKWLCLSSTIFSVPAYYALINGLSIFTLVNAVTVSASLWHWSDAKENTIARKIDVNWCKINFIIYFIAGCTFSRELWIWVLGIAGIFWGGYCFYRSSFLQTDKYWFVWHATFHISVALQQILVLYAMITQNAAQYLPKPF